MSTKKIHDSQLIIESSDNEVVNLRLDTSDKEKDADFMVLGDGNLEEELIQEANNHTPQGVIMEGLV